jgi:8-oxo-dGTP pyrophosphatase MutT (NUDIX family)
LHALRRAFEPVIRPLMHLYWRFARGATLGARAMVIDGTGRVFLVKHSYVDGWHLPGGGVETGETMLTALARELAEEGNIRLAGEPKLHGLFFNSRMSRRDHVALYVVREFTQDGAPVPNH